jgi:hypothetical protein
MENSSRAGVEGGREREEGRNLECLGSMKLFHSDIIASSKYGSITFLSPSPTVVRCLAIPAS